MLVVHESDRRKTTEVNRTNHDEHVLEKRRHRRREKREDKNGSRCRAKHSSESLPREITFHFETVVHRSSTVAATCRQQAETFALDRGNFQRDFPVALLRVQPSLTDEMVPRRQHESMGAMLVVEESTVRTSDRFADRQFPLDRGTRPNRAETNVDSRVHLALEWSYPAVIMTNLDLS